MNPTKPAFAALKSRVKGAKLLGRKGRMAKPIAFAVAAE